MKIKFISDGDVSGAISVVDPKTNIDIYIGIGGGPEGVLAAAAFHVWVVKFKHDCFDDEQKKRAKN